MKKYRRFTDKEMEDIQSQMISYALKKLIDAFIESYKNISKAKAEERAAKAKAEALKKEIEEKMRLEKSRIKFGKFEMSTEAFGKGAKYVIPIISALGVAVSATTFVMKNLDNARRVSGEIRRWNERLDKRRLEAEKRRQEMWQIERQKLLGEQNSSPIEEKTETRRRGRPPKQEKAEQPAQRRRGRPRKGS